MVVGRAARRERRRSRVAEAVGEHNATHALDLLELVELAWHDCYGESSPPESVIDDILVLGRGDLSLMISAARLAVVDFRDARLAADELRE